jgi:hypothetical protein
MAINKYITHWTIKVKWSDGTEETLDYIPNYVAKNVDEHLTLLENEHNK